MMTQSLDHYHTRMIRVLDHIDAHLDEELDLDRLSGVAAFSKFHFHRQFRTMFGLPAHLYVQLARMKRASWRLAFRAEESVTGIAFDAAYEAPDAFARAFRQRFGQSPTAFRKSPDWERWLSALGPFDTARKTIMSTNYSVEDVTIRTVAATPIAVMSHRGNPALLGDTIRRFIDWRRSEGLPPARAPTFTIWHNDPRGPDPDGVRIDLAVGVDRPERFADGVISAGEIPGGRRAVLRVIGSSDDLEAPASWLYGEWLPQSGEEVADLPLYCQRISFFPDVPAHEAVTDLYLPLR